jgi:hypothetical protein
MRIAISVGAALLLSTTAQAAADRGVALGIAASLAVDNGAHSPHVLMPIAIDGGVQVRRALWLHAFVGGGPAIGHDGSRVEALVGPRLRWCSGPACGGGSVEVGLSSTGYSYDQVWTRADWFSRLGVEVQARLRGSLDVASFGDAGDPVRVALELSAGVRAASEGAPVTPIAGAALLTRW